MSSTAENDLIFHFSYLQAEKLLGNDSIKTISKALVQVFISVPPDHLRMRKQETGVLSLIKDYSRKNYYFRFYGLKSKCVWENKFHGNMKYIESSPFVHLFQGKENIVLFSFARQTDAKIFKTAVDQKILKANEAKAKHIPRYQSMRAPQSQVDTDISKPASNKVKRTKSNTKNDIGMPKDFIQMFHVSSSNKGLAVIIKEHQLEDLFQKTCLVQPKQMQELRNDLLKKQQAKEREPPGLPPKKAGTDIIYAELSFPSNLDAKKETEAPVLNKVKRTGSIKKSDIGKPTNFTPILNVSWVAGHLKFEWNDDLDVFMRDDKIKSQLKKAEVSENPLQDIAFPEFIKEFINKYNVNTQVDIEISKPALNEVNRTECSTKKEVQYATILHVGSDDNLDVLMKDDKVKSLLTKAGVSENQLQDEDTREFIKEFLKKYYVETDSTLANKKDQPILPPKTRPRNNLKNHVKMDPEFENKEDQPILPPRVARRVAPTPSAPPLEENLVE